MSVCYMNAMNNVSAQPVNHTRTGAVYQESFRYMLSIWMSPYDK